MIGKLTLAASLATLALAFAPNLASAAGARPQSAFGTTDVGSSVRQTVQFGSCRRWRHLCADRHGWRTRGYFRCLERHGC